MVAVSATVAVTVTAAVTATVAVAATETVAVTATIGIAGAAGIVAAARHDLMNRSKRASPSQWVSRHYAESRIMPSSGEFSTVREGSDSA